MNFKHKLERQIPNLPNEVKWCKKCVISNQRPRITFSEDGVCSACLNKDYKDKIDWVEKERELVELLDSHRRNDGMWDVIVPSSGGKDSGYVAHQLKYKYNMNPLTVTWSPLKYTEIGRKNFDACVESGLNNILASPNGKFQRKLARLCLEELGDAFHVFVLGQVCFPFHMALKFGVKLVFYGENGGLEYAAEPESLNRPYTPSSEWTNKSFKGVTLRELLEYGIKHKNYLNEEDFTESDLSFYEPPSEKDLKKAGILGKHFYSYYHKWIPQENYYYCAENTGFAANTERSEGTYSKYASLDDKMDGFHFYLRYIKFGLGRCIEDVSHEVRDGHLTREEAVILMRKYDGEFPKKYFDEFLQYLDINQDKFWEIVDSWRSPHLWTKKNNEWILKNPIS